MTYTIDTVENLTKLINDRIYIDNLEITASFNISDYIEFLENLTHLNFKYYCRCDIDFSQFPNLSHLQIQTDKLNISNISKLSNLTYLGITNQQTIDFLLLTNLTYLSFACKNVENFAGLSNLKHLNFNVKNGQIPNISLFSNLTYLRFGEYPNPIDFLKLTNLENLEIGYGYEHLIDLSNLSNLTKIFVPATFKGCVDFSQCHKLKKVKFGYNLKKCSIELSDTEKLGVVDVPQISQSYLESCVVKR